MQVRAPRFFRARAQGLVQRRSLRVWEGNQPYKWKAEKPEDAFAWLEADLWDAYGVRRKFPGGVNAPEYFKYLKDRHTVHPTMSGVGNYGSNYILWGTALFVSAAIGPVVLAQYRMGYKFFGEPDLEE